MPTIDVPDAIWIALGAWLTIAAIASVAQIRVVTLSAKLERLRIKHEEARFQRDLAREARDRAER